MAQTSLKISVPNFSSMSFTNGWFFTFLWSQIWGTICNFVAMATAQNVTNWFYLQKMSWTCIFKVRKLQRDTLSRLRMVVEIQEGGVSPRGKIGLKGRYQIKQNGNHVVKICLRQACCKGVTEEETARNISTFLLAPIIWYGAVWYDKW